MKGFKMKKIILTGLIATLLMGAASTANADVFFGLRGGAEKLKVKNTSISLDEGKTDLMFGAFVGYHYSFFRLEGEYLYHMDRDYMGDSMKLESHSAMGNLYFSPPVRTFLHPYLMGGVGATFHDLSLNGDSDKKTVFSWQLGIGLELEFTENVFLDVGGRFARYGKAELNKEKYEVGGYSYFGGLRFEY